MRILLQTSVSNANRSPSYLNYTYQSGRTALSEGWNGYLQFAVDGDYPSQESPIWWKLTGEGLNESDITFSEDTDLQLNALNRGYYGNHPETNGDGNFYFHIPFSIPNDYSTEGLSLIHI